MSAPWSLNYNNPSIFSDNNGNSIAFSWLNTSTIEIIESFSTCQSWMGITCTNVSGSSIPFYSFPISWQDNNSNLQTLTIKNNSPNTILSTYNNGSVITYVAILNLPNTNLSNTSTSQGISFNFRQRYKLMLDFMSEKYYFDIYC